MVGGYANVHWDTVCTFTLNISTLKACVLLSRHSPRMALVVKGEIKQKYCGEVATHHRLHRAPTIDCR